MSGRNGPPAEWLAERAGMDRWVTLVCTGQGRGGHPKKRVDRVGIVDGAAMSIENRGAKVIREAMTTKYAGRTIADFNLICTRCLRGPQLTNARMTKLVTVWLAAEPTRQSVVRDISEPTIARMM